MLKSPAVPVIVGAYPDEKCLACRHLQQETVFDLCTTEESQYTADGRRDWHTVGHMRSRYGACGTEARLCRPAKVTT